MAKIVISYPFTGNFYQTENKSAQFLNRIDSLHKKHKKKTKKCVGVASYDTLSFKRLMKIMLFAKSYGWIHDPPASMALPLDPKNMIKFLDS
jgi:hypothetical protein